MWTTTYEATTGASAAAVWDALTTLHSGTPIGPHSDAFELHGPFAVGTALTVTPQGQGPLQSVIVELEPGRVYADQTVFGDVTLTFRHRLTARADGGTVVAHTLELTGAGAETAGTELGPQISADFPVAMAELLAAAERTGTEAAPR